MQIILCCVWNIYLSNNQIIFIYKEKYVTTPCLISKAMCHFIFLIFAFAVELFMTESKGIKTNWLKKKSTIIYFFYMTFICLIGIFNKNITFLWTSLTQALCLSFLFATPTSISLHTHLYVNIATHTETYFQPENFCPLFTIWL